MLDTLTVLESLDCDIRMYVIRLLRGLLNCYKSLKLKSVVERCILHIFKQIRMVHCRIRSLARKFLTCWEKEIMYSSAHEAFGLLNFRSELITLSSLNLAHCFEISFNITLLYMSWFHYFSFSLPFAKIYIFFRKQGKYQRHF